MYILHSVTFIAKEICLICWPNPDNVEDSQYEVHTQFTHMLCYFVRPGVFGPVQG